MHNLYWNITDVHWHYDTVQFWEMLLFMIHVHKCRLFSKLPAYCATVDVLDGTEHYWWYSLLIENYINGRFGHNTLMLIDTSLILNGYSRSCTVSFRRNAHFKLNLSFIRFSGTWLMNCLDLKLYSLHSLCLVVWVNCCSNTACVSQSKWKIFKRWNAFVALWQSITCFDTEAMFTWSLVPRFKSPNRKKHAPCTP